MIVPLTENSIGPWLAALKEIDQNTPGEAWTDQHFLYSLPLKWDLSMVIKEGDQVQGFLVASARNGMGHIHRLAIQKEVRGKGYGKMLIDELRKKLGLLDLKGITLKVASDNRQAIRFYERMGFQASEREGNNLWMKQLIERND